MGVIDTAYKWLTGKNYDALRQRYVDHHRKHIKILTKKNQELENTQIELDKVRTQNEALHKKIRRLRQTQRLSIENTDTLLSIAQKMYEYIEQVQETYNQPRHIAERERERIHEEAQQIIIDIEKLETQRTQEQEKVVKEWSLEELEEQYGELQPPKIPQPIR